MSWLEYLGLAYLLDDDNALDFSGVGTGMLFLFGIGSWLLVAIFQGDLVDQGATVFNLLATALLFQRLSRPGGAADAGRHSL